MAWAPWEASAVWLLDQNNSVQQLTQKEHFLFQGPEWNYGVGVPTISTR